MRSLIAKPLILLLLVLTVFSVSFFVWHNRDESTLLSYKVSSVEEAEVLSETHDLMLHHVSPSGIATFETDEDYHHLLTQGFAVNQISTTQSPPFSTTSDTFLNDQYALDMMDTYEAWDLVTGDASVMVAIIDTGIDINHIEFQGRLSPLSYNATTEQVGLSHVLDDQDHGTRVAGVIAANKDNNEGIAGIAQNVELLIIKANEDGEDAFYDNVLAESIYYAVDQGADIINMSLGGPYENQTVQDAINYAHQNEVIVVAAAGNDGTDEPQYPAAYDHVVAVSSVDEDGQISEFSNYGDFIDITAPGGEIVTTVMNDSYKFVSGTSFAAPQITGVLALIKSLDTSQSYTDILNGLYGGATDLNDPLYYGVGLANTYQSVKLDYVKLTFDTDYDSVEPIFHPKDTTISDLPTLTAQDKLFLGWYLDSDFTTPFESDTILNNDTTLYAKWVDETYTITFLDETSVLNETTYDYEETPTLYEPIKDDHRFLGWYLDDAFAIEYTPEPITKDMTLYAKFEPVVYHTVTIMSDDQTLNTYEVIDETPLDNPSENKPHHTFDGYYKDQALTNPFDTNTVITQDMTLYAKFTPNTYTITYIKDDAVIDEQDVTYNQDFTLREVTDNTRYFIGWYLDDTFNTAYEKLDTLTEDVTLYAYFVSDAHEITLHIDDRVETLYVLPNDPVDLPTPKKAGHVFVDWYIDSDLTTVFDDTTHTQDITLYAQFAKEHYTVTFYDYDNETIFQELTVPYNDPLPEVSAPIKPSNTHFTYTFTGWDTEIDTVTSNMSIYPTFEKTFIAESVSLAPGIDTVDTREAWTDAGLIYDEAILNIDTTIPNMSMPGTYVIHYTLYDDDGEYGTLYRYVTLRDAQPPLELTLKKGVTSLFEGDTFTDPGVEYSRGSLTVESTVNTDVSGVYTITYILSDDTQTIKKIRYVHVFDTLDTALSLPPLYYTRKKEATL